MNESEALWHGGFIGWFFSLLTMMLIAAYRWFLGRPNFKIQEERLLPILPRGTGSSFITGSISLRNVSHSLGNFELKLIHNGRETRPVPFEAKCEDIRRDNRILIHLDIDNSKITRTCDSMGLWNNSVDVFSRQPFTVAPRTLLSGWAIFYLGEDIRDVSEIKLVMRHVESGKTDDKIIQLTESGG